MHLDISGALGKNVGMQPAKIFILYYCGQTDKYQWKFTIQIKHWTGLYIQLSKYTKWKQGTFTKKAKSWYLPLQAEVYFTQFNRNIHYMKVKIERSACILFPACWDPTRQKSSISTEPFVIRQSSKCYQMQNFVSEI